MKALLRSYIKGCKGQLYLISLTISLLSLQAIIPLFNPSRWTFRHRGPPILSGEEPIPTPLRDIYSQMYQDDRSGSDNGKPPVERGAYSVLELWRDDILDRHGEEEKQTREDVPEWKELGGAAPGLIFNGKKNKLGVGRGAAVGAGMARRLVPTYPAALGTQPSEAPARVCVKKVRTLGGDIANPQDASNQFLLITATGMTIFVIDHIRH